MSASDYQFITEWRIESTAEELFAVLTNTPDFPRWCPAVYLAVKQIEQPKADGTGRVVELHTKGRLPYTLRWFSRLIESRAPHRFSIEAWGDFVGRGVWTLDSDGRFVNVRYDWRIRVAKPLISRMSFLLKPLFSANHRWAMARMEESLRVELARRTGAGQQSAAQSS